jgi:hypothetical protein
MMNRYWLPSDTENLAAVLVLVALALVVLVMWLAGINTKGTKQ